MRTNLIHKTLVPLKNEDDINLKRFPFLNKYTYWLLQNLKWPKAAILFFETEHEARKVLKVLFPNPKLVEAEKVEIRVQIITITQVTTAENIDLDFQSSLNELKSLLAKPLKVIQQ